MTQFAGIPCDDRNTARKGQRAAMLVLLAAGAAGVLATSLTVVDATQYALVLRFGRIVRAIDTPGLAFVTPFDRVVRLDRRLLFFSPPPSEFLTSDKKNVVAQPLLAWRIAAPEQFLASVGDRAGAEAKLADIALAEIGSVLGRYPFAALVSANGKHNAEQAPLREIRTRVSAAARSAYGIEIAEIGLRQISLPQQNRQSVFERMKAERGRLAKRYRSEGELEAKRITAEADRHKVRLGADAYAEAQRIRADADAGAARIYASIYGRDPSFYWFFRTLQAYGSILDENTTIVLPSSAEALTVLHEQAPRVRPNVTPPPSYASPPTSPQVLLGPPATREGAP